MAKPRLLYDNRLADAAPVASSTAAGDFNVANLADFRPYTWWKPAAMPATVTVDRGTAIAPHKGTGSMTVTRSGTATRVNGSGLVEVVPADTPRFDHDPVTLACKGLLSEPTRENLCLRSEEFDNASWSKTDTTITPNDTTAPDGAQTADLVTEGSAGTALLGQTIVATADANYAISRFVKRGNHDWVVLHLQNGANIARAWFNLATGAKGSLTAAGTGAAVSSEMEPMANGFYRCTLVGSVGSGVTSIAFRSHSADADASVTRVAGATRHEWGAQFEDAADSASSYIPTTSAAVTRNGDQPRVASVAGFFNAAEGTMVAEVSLNARLGNQRYAQFDDGTSNNVIRLDRAGSSDASRIVVQTGGVAQAQPSVAQPDLDDGHVFRAACGYKANYFQVAAEGALGVADTSGTLPAVTQLSLAVSNANSLQLFGHLRYFEYIPKLVSDAELAAISKLGAEPDTRASLRFDFTRPAGAADTLLIWGHDLATQGATVELRGSLDNFVANDVLIATRKPTSDAPLLLFFNRQWYRYWRLRFTGATAPTIAIAVIGEALESPVHFEGEFSPIDREVSGRTNRNENGHPLGRIVDFESWKSKIQFRFVRWSWAREEMAPAWTKHLRGSPFVIAWDADGHPEDARLVQAGDELRIPHRAGSLCHVEFDVQGVV
jgi:hypothetical protein